MNPAKTILLAEHDPFLINVYAVELRKCGYNISVVSNGENVLNRVRNIEPDLMILDASLPNSESNYHGLSVLKLVKDDLILKNLKVVMLCDAIQKKESEGKFFRLGSEKNFSKSESTAEEIAVEVKRLLN